MRESGSGLTSRDRGYRVIVARDALCSGNDVTHNALLKLYQQRFSSQLEPADRGAMLQGRH